MVVKTEDLGFVVVQVQGLYETKKSNTICKCEF